MIQTDKNGVPLKEAFAFGYRVCAVCHEFTPYPHSRALTRPIYADYAETEVLIPAGRQHFHKDCHWKIVEGER